MNQSFPIALSVLALLGLAIPASAQIKTAPKKPPAPPTSPVVAARTDPNGFWEGKLDTGAGLSLTLSFHIEGEGKNRTATLSVPEQNAKNLPVGKTTIQDKAVAFEMPNIGASFAGTLSADGKQIVGTFTQGAKLPLTLVRKEAAATLKRPQEPKAPFPYKTVDVSYPNPNATGVTLAGTLTVPKGAGPFPVVLFITGSGPQDRDETLLGHRPFAVIADYLARRGIASLRCDDRGVAKSTGNFAAATSADFASDTRAGIAYLKTRKDIDLKKIGLIGHSEGGLIAPMVAADTPDVAFVVLLAGTGVTGEKILLAQQQLIARAMGAPEDTIKTNAVISKRMFDAMRAESDPKKLEVALDAIIEEEIAKMPEANRKEAQEQLKTGARQLLSPWFRYFLTYDPAPTLKKVRCPVLAINGSKDLQVPPKMNLPAIETALKAGGDADVTTKELPDLNHLFQTCKTGAPSEYAGIEETFSPAALKVVGDWITAHTK